MAKPIGCSASDLERLGLLERCSPDFEQACEWVKDSRSS
ncbi:hypothetical protein SynMVIR181_00182 [Synechococcus sp. MVIR-18-1]|nr:hypothetical protein SynMVIR181_00182 [Synechococcus sp. MVIR-18-1]